MLEMDLSEWYSDRLVTLSLNVLLECNFFFDTVREVDDADEVMLCSFAGNFDVVFSMHSQVLLFCASSLNQFCYWTLVIGGILPQGIVLENKLQGIVLFDKMKDFALKDFTLTEEDTYQEAMAKDSYFKDFFILHKSGKICK